MRDTRLGAYADYAEAIANFQLAAWSEICSPGTEHMDLMNAAQAESMRAFSRVILVGPEEIRESIHETQRALRELSIFAASRTAPYPGMSNDLEEYVRIVKCSQEFEKVAAGQFGRA